MTVSKSKTPQGEWPFLDLLRAVAAFLVLIGHARNYYFAPIGSLDHPGPLLKLFWFVTVLHHEAVVVFFILSGFLVGGSVVNAMRAGRFNLRDYLIARFARIYPVLLPALAVTALIFWLGSTFFADPGGGEEIIRPLFSDRQTDFGGAALLCHLVNIQGYACATWTEDSPLWSLGYEWVLYLFAPMVIGLVLGRMPVATRAIGLALVIGLAVSLAAKWDDCLFWFSVWFLGVAASQIAQSRRLPLAAGVAGCALAVAAMVVSRFKIFPVMETDTVIALGMALAVSCRSLIALRLLPRFFHWAAGFSYSLYAIHLPILFLVIALFQKLGLPAVKMPPAPRTFAVFGATVAVALVGGYVFSLATEKQTRHLRAYLSGRVPSKGG
ncbi:MAG: acyltransferase [Alphaproteobacteria bacterium]|nr:acyltransferase [Alphaproteobacteria bacterium]